MGLLGALLGDVIDDTGNPAHDEQAEQLEQLAQEIAARQQAGQLQGMGDASDIIGKLSQSIPGIVTAFTDKPGAAKPDDKKAPPAGSSGAGGQALEAVKKYGPWVAGGLVVAYIAKKALKGRSK